MIKKDILIGVLVGLIANTIGFLIFTALLGQGDSIFNVIEAASKEGFLGKLISLGAILNLVAFFIFIKKKQDYKARGVLLITIFVAVFTFVFKVL